MRLIYLLLLSSPLLLTNCTADIDVPWFNDDSDEIIYEEAYTLVYIDLSLSQDKVGLNTTLTHLETIYLNQPSVMKSTFVVRAIDTDNETKDLFNSEMEGLKSSRKFKIDERELLLNELAQKMNDSIQYYVNNDAKKVNSFKETCISNTLEKSYMQLNHLEREKTLIRMVIISDMFEECNQKNSIFKEDFDMCGHYKNSTHQVETLSAIIEKYEPKEKLSKYVSPENLHFIVTKDQKYQGSGVQCLDVSDTKIIWQEFLLKMGYAEEDLNSEMGITYSFKISDRLKNQN